jgi:ribosomal protein L11 methyltransferase
VLAIAASLLGAVPVVAVDDDPDAIASASENLALNPGAHLSLDVVDLKSAALTPASVVVANLTGGLLVQAAARLREVVSDTGTLILSGLMQTEEADVLAAYHDFRLVSRGQEDEWICVTLQRQGAFL